MSESQEGLVLAAFTQPVHALLWALTTQSLLLEEAWNPALLVRRGQHVCM